MKAKTVETFRFVWNLLFFVLAFLSLAALSRQARGTLDLPSVTNIEQRSTVVLAGSEDSDL